MPNLDDMFRYPRSELYDDSNIRIRVLLDRLQHELASSTVQTILSILSEQYRVHVDLEQVRYVGGGVNLIPVRISQDDVESKHPMTATEVRMRQQPQMNPSYKDVLLKVDKAFTEARLSVANFDSAICSSVVESKRKGKRK